LVLSVAPQMRWQEVRDLLQRTARRIDAVGGQYDGVGHSHLYGYGQVDARSALLGIDAVIETERATDTVALDSGIRSFIEVVDASAVGRVIAGWITERRFGVLTLLQSSNEFREALARILRV